MVPPFNTPNKMQPYLAVKRTSLKQVSIAVGGAAGGGWWW
jgi:hypothetical protein